MASCVGLAPVSVFPVFEDPIQAIAGKFADAVSVQNLAQARELVQNLRESEIDRLVDFLKQREIAIVNGEGRDFLQRAIEEGCNEVAIVLLRAKPNIAGQRPRLYLSAAVDAQRPDIVEYFCLHHPEAVRAESAPRWNLLHAAVLSYSFRRKEEPALKIVRLLSDIWPQGAEEPDNKGTPLDLANSYRDICNDRWEKERSPIDLFVVGLNASKVSEKPSSLKRFGGKPLFDRNVVGPISEFLSMEKAKARAYGRIVDIFKEAMLPHCVEEFIQAVNEDHSAIGTIQSTQRRERIYPRLRDLNTSQKKQFIEILKSRKEELLVGHGGVNFLERMIGIFPFYCLGDDAVILMMQLRPDAIMSCRKGTGTMVHVAALYGKLEIVKAMLSLLPCPAEDLLIRNAMGATPLHIAVCGGNFLVSEHVEESSIEMVKVIMKACPKALEVRDLEGFLPEEIARTAAQADGFSPSAREIYQRIADILSEGRKQLQEQRRQEQSRKLVFAVALSEAGLPNAPETPLKRFINNPDYKNTVLKTILAFTG